MPVRFPSRREIARPTVWVSAPRLQRLLPTTHARAGRHPAAGLRARGRGPSDLAGSTRHRPAGGALRRGRADLRGARTQDGGPPTGSRLRPPAWQRRQDARRPARKKGACRPPELDRHPPAPATALQPERRSTRGSDLLCARPALDRPSRAAYEPRGAHLRRSAHDPRHSSPPTRWPAEPTCAQEMLGHASIRTTEIYTHLDEEHVRAVHRMHHPRG